MTVTTVGIMTMQRILNYGSTLQAYALKRLIEGLDQGIDASFVDFHPGPLLTTTERPTSASTWVRALAKIREYGAVEGSMRDRVLFMSHKLNYARKYFPLVGIPRQPVHDVALDVQVIGSDEVFNCVQANSNVGYSRDLFGHGSRAKRVVSYAASFGNTTLARIETAGIATDLAHDLSRFHAISVRDRNSADIVEVLTGQRPEIHVDPVIAYDFSRERVPSQRLWDGRYIIVYGYSGRLSRQENDELRRYAASIDADILTFGGVQECGDRFIDCSPLELLAYFRDAEAVVTDTFHGTILAMVNNVQFATIVRSSREFGYGNEEKLGFLLESFGLQDRRVGQDGVVARLGMPTVDFAAVNRLIAQARAATSDYLMRAIGVGEDVA